MIRSQNQISNTVNNVTRDNEKPKDSPARQPNLHNCWNIPAMMGEQQNILELILVPYDRLPANSAGLPHFLSQSPLHQPEQTFQTDPCGKAVGPSHHSQQTRWLHQRDDSEIKQRTFKIVRYSQSTLNYDTVLV